MKNQETAAHASGECPVCRGTGWELYTEVLEDGRTIQSARRCEMCSGLRRAAEQTGIPLHYQSSNLTQFDFKAYSVNLEKLQKLCKSFVEKFGDWESVGKGLYFWSNTPGSGKTFLSCCLVNEIMLKYHARVRFVTAADYIAAVGESYKRERGSNDGSEVYRTCRLLVLDDIGAQAGNDWHRQEIFRLINCRMENGLVTVFTSNSEVEELNVDDRTKDRIIKSSVVLQMPEESVRREMANKEQAEFIRRILEQ